MAMQILSVIMVIAMALSGLSGAVLSSGAQEPVSVDVGVSVNADPEMLAAMTGNTSMQPEAIDSIAKLISGLKIHAAVDPQASELAILLNDATLAAVGVKKTDGGYSVVTSLLPSYKLTMKQETLDMLMQQSMGGMTNAFSGNSGMDISKVMEAITPHIQGFIEELSSKVGTPETGSFTVDGEEYTAKIPINATSKEMAIMAVGYAKKIVEDEAVAGLLTQFNVQMPNLDETLENLQNTDEANMPVLDAGMYSNEAGGSCTQVKLEKEDQRIDVIIASAENSRKYKVDVMDQLKISVTADTEAKLYNIEASYMNNGMMMMLEGQIKNENDYTIIAVNFGIPMGEKQLAAGLAVQIGKDAPAAVEDEGLTEYPLEALMAGSENGGDAALQAELSTGFMSLLSAIMAASPELATMLMPTMQTTNP